MKMAVSLNPGRLASKNYISPSLTLLSYKIPARARSGSRPRVDGKELLFDNLADPYQLVNLAEDAAFDDRKSELRAMMQGKMKELGDTFEASSYYRENWVNKGRLIPATATQQRAQQPDNLST